MYFPKVFFRIRIVVAVMTVGMALTSANLSRTAFGSTGSRAKSAQASQSSNQRKSRASRLPDTTSEIDRLRKEVDALSALIKEQREAMSSFQQRLDAIQAGGVPAI